MYTEEKIAEHFCRKLKKLGTEIINYKKKAMIPLTKLSFMKTKNNVTYVKKGFLEIKRINVNT